MRFFISLVLVLFSNLLFADNQELDSYFKKIEPEIIYGPNQVDIEGIATFDIEYGQSFINRKHLTDIYRILGKRELDPNDVGWVLPGTPGDDTDENDHSFSLVKVEFAELGYISDDVDWNYDKLIELISEKQERGGNKVLDWVQRPNYEKSKHSLNWSYELRNAKGEHIDVYQNIVLGRSGILGFSVITPSINRNTMIEMNNRLLDSSEFSFGNKYEDYQSGIDKESAIGLAGLVGGVAVAKKLGLFAILLALVAKFGKFIILGLGGLAILFGLKKKKSKVESQAGRDEM